MTFLIACEFSEQLLGSAIKLGSSTPSSVYTKLMKIMGICFFIASMAAAIIVSKRVELVLFCKYRFSCVGLMC